MSATFLKILPPRPVGFPPPYFLAPTGRFLKGKMIMETYEEVAKAAGLDQNTTRRFLAYMKTRWSKSEREKCIVGYAAEWADRFKSGREYAASDTFGQRVLCEIDNKGGKNGTTQITP